MFPCYLKFSHMIEAVFNYKTNKLILDLKSHFFVLIVFFFRKNNCVYSFV
jgi:hypothetical protein